MPPGVGGRPDVSGGDDGGVKVGVRPPPTPPPSTALVGLRTGITVCPETFRDTYRGVLAINLPQKAYLVAAGGGRNILTRFVRRSSPVVCTLRIKISKFVKSGKLPLSSRRAQTYRPRTSLRGLGVHRNPSHAFHGRSE